MDAYPPAKNLTARGDLGLEEDINGGRMSIGSNQALETADVVLMPDMGISLLVTLNGLHALRFKVWL